MIFRDYNLEREDRILELGVYRGPGISARRASPRDLDPYGRLVLGLRNGSNVAVKYFSVLIDARLADRCGVAVVPRSEGQNREGLQALVACLCGGTRTDLSRCLEYRNRLGEREPMAKAARKPENKVRVIDPAAVGGTEVLLIDDIPAGPSLFKDCEQALLQAGAAKVVCLALARPELSGLAAVSREDSSHRQPGKIAAATEKARSTGAFWWTREL